MKDMDEILNATAKDFYFIGERLKLIREELIENDDVEDKRSSIFSRKNMAERFGVDYQTITNVERGPLSLTTIKLILYYYSLGYNPMWIMSPDNEFITKHNVGENVVYQSDVQDQYKELESSIVTALSLFKENL
ncbi:helix-turn-helix domain-containing protein [Flagellimonas pacifica]|uniref:Uncharacterized protein n=1 Tax=Flagellimonas pacifica TaxID=1247520 RepID=A0A285MWD8_9FLAO|nr:helix-turn-helix transcriptional regulator [Allomuricauda parva]SNZ01428.1 hypothetical protein SAMN06265377_3267 [Allomuricauda parva]